MFAEIIMIPRAECQPSAKEKFNPFTKPTLDVFLEETKTSPHNIVRIDVPKDMISSYYSIFILNGLYFFVSIMIRLMNKMVIYDCTISP